MIAEVTEFAKRTNENSPAILESATKLSFTAPKAQSLKGFQVIAGGAALTRSAPGYYTSRLQREELLLTTLQLTPLVL